MLDQLVLPEAAPFLGDVNLVIAKHVGGAELPRFETQGQENEATCHVNISAIHNRSMLVDNLQEKFPHIKSDLYRSKSNFKPLK
jgi:hypothetical protein